MKGKKALLVVSFGSTYKKPMEASIGAVEKALQKAFPQEDLYRAFSSQMVIHRLKEKENLSIRTMEEAMQDLLAKGYEQVRCQTTHLLNGVETARLLAVLHQYQARFQTLQVGAPLLSTPGDMQNIVEWAIKAYPLAKDEAAVLVGHGTNHFANAAYAALDYAFRAKGQTAYQIGTVEGYPDMQATLQALQKLAIKKVWLVPLLVVAGEHALHDINGEKPHTWKTVLTKAGYQVKIVEKGLGEEADIQQLFVEHAKAATPLAK
ncbi:MAG TPA: sirohydrochlorin cobaltochelatase [Ruminococcaceae bacterium]|nr:sirohydrochlorin cobaltochelatase [Oscillospiraceae bacterium]